MEQEQAIGSRSAVIFAPETRWGEITPVTEVQSLVLTGTPTGGSFKLGFMGIESGSITYNTTEATTAAAIQVALLAMSNIGGSNVSVSAPGAQDTYTITFAASLASVGLPLLTLSTNALTGGTSPTGTVTRLTAGTPRWRQLRIQPGTSLQPNFATYKSKEITRKRIPRKTVYGTMRPDGTLPCELSPRGWNPFFYHLLGGSVTTTPGPVNQVQTIQTTGGATGGTFRLEFNGKSTTDLAYNASASAIQTALQSLSTIGSGNATCAGGDLPAAVNVSFVSSLAGTNNALIGVSDNSLTGGTEPEVCIDETTQGIPSGYYKHVLVGSVALPTGFSIEEQHLDLASSDKPYFGFLGGRVNSFSGDVTIDQTLGGTFQLMFREALDPSSTSLNTGPTPEPDTDDPYTAVQVSLLEGSTRRDLGTMRQFSFAISNNFNADKGFAIGDNRRKNLKAGDRTTNGSATVMFNNSDLIAKAKAGTNTTLKLLAVSGQSSMEFLWPNVRLLPTNGIWPVITDSGQLEISLLFEAAEDTTIGSPTNGTEIQLTIVTPEPDITI